VTYRASKEEIKKKIDIFLFHTLFFFQLQEADGHPAGFFVFFDWVTKNRPEHDFFWPPSSWNLKKKSLKTMMGPGRSKCWSLLDLSVCYHNLRGSVFKFSCTHEYPRLTFTPVTVANCLLNPSRYSHLPTVTNSKRKTQ